MSQLLLLHSSLNGKQGLSSSLAGHYVSAWRDANPEGAVTERDLAANPVPHLDVSTFGAFSVPQSERTSVELERVALSDRLIAELQGADVVVMAVPMHNFAIPSTLSAYFDHVARARVTFRYTPSGPQGLLEGKRAVVFATRGGRYAGTPADLQTAYLRRFLGFIGIKDVKFVYAEGTAGGKDAATAAGRKALDEAAATLPELPQRAGRDFTQLTQETSA